MFIDVHFPCSGEQQTRLLLASLVQYHLTPRTDHNVKGPPVEQAFVAHPCTKND